MINYDFYSLNDLYRLCERVLNGLGVFARNCVNYLFTEVPIGNLVTTPFELLTVGFFTFLSARIALNMITG